MHVGGLPLGWGDRISREQSCPTFGFCPLMTGTCVWLLCLLGWAGVRETFLSGAQGSVGFGVRWGGPKGTGHLMGLCCSRRPQPASGHSSFIEFCSVAELVLALGGSDTQNPAPAPGMPCWAGHRAEKSQPGPWEWGHCTGVLGPRLRGGLPRCPRFVPKMRAGLQGHPLMVC